MPQSRSDGSAKLLSSLGLCARAGALVYGTPMVCEALRAGGKKQPLLVLEAADTSEATHKKLTDKCTFYGVRHVRLPVGGDALAAALGKSAVLAAVAVCDESLCRMLAPRLDGISSQDNE